MRVEEKLPPTNPLVVWRNFSRDLREQFEKQILKGRIWSWATRFMTSNGKSISFPLRKVWKWGGRKVDASRIIRIITTFCLASCSKSTQTRTHSPPFLRNAVFDWNRIDEGEWKALKDISQFRSLPYQLTANPGSLNVSVNDDRLDNFSFFFHILFSWIFAQLFFDPFWLLLCTFRKKKMLSNGRLYKKLNRKSIWKMRLENLF